MQKRTRGTGGLKVSALGCGCMGISFGYGQPTNREDGIGISAPPRMPASRSSTRPKRMGPSTARDSLPGRIPNGKGRPNPC
jgi:hypothetical protein